MNNQTIGLLFILGLLSYLFWSCEKEKQKNIMQKLNLRTEEGFRLPFRCNPYGTYFQWHGIPRDPYHI